MCDFLKRWLSLEVLKKVPPAELRKFFRQRRQGRHHELTEDRRAWLVRCLECVAKEDMEICGVRLRLEEPILFLNAAANRDPQRFYDPNRLDLKNE